MRVSSSSQTSGDCDGCRERKVILGWGMDSLECIGSANIASYGFIGTEVDVDPSAVFRCPKTWCSPISY